MRAFNNVSRTVLLFPHGNEGIPIYLSEIPRQLRRAVNVSHAAAGEGIAGDGDDGSGDQHGFRGDALEGLRLDGDQGGGEDEGRGGVMIAVFLSTSRIYPSAVYLSYSAALPSFVPSQAAIRC